MKNKEPYYPEFELVKIIAGACLKHYGSGEGTFNKEARVIINELESNGYRIVKNKIKNVIQTNTKRKS